LIKFGELPKLHPLVFFHLRPIKNKALVFFPHMTSLLCLPCISKESLFSGDGSFSIISIFLKSGRNQAINYIFHNRSPNNQKANYTSLFIDFTSFVSHNHQKENFIAQFRNFKIFCLHLYHKANHNAQ